MAYASVRRKPGEQFGQEARALNLIGDTLTAVFNASISHL
jgi:hypothetical protein